MTKITRTIGSIVLLLGAVLTNSIPVCAQESSAPAGGTWDAIKSLPSRDELIVNLKDGSSKKGRLTDATDTVVVLSQGKKITELRRDEIIRVYRSVPKSRMVGTATGAAIGGGFSLLSALSHDVDPKFTIAAVVFWAGLGALIGRGIARGHQRVLIYEARK